MLKVVCLTLTYFHVAFDVRILYKNGRGQGRGLVGFWGGRGISFDVFISPYKETNGCPTRDRTLYFKDHGPSAVSVGAAF